MSLGELVNELRGNAEPAPLAEVALENKLAGKVTQEGNLKLDTADLSSVSARLREVRLKLSTLKKEEDQLRLLILSHPDAKAGFQNGAIEIEGTLAIDLGNPELLSVLMATKTFASCCNLSLSLPKVRALAELNSKVAAKIKTLKGRRIKIVK